MNASNLFDIDCINRLLNFLPWSRIVYLALTIDVLIFHTVLPVVLLKPPNRLFLSVIPRYLKVHIAVSELELDDPLGLGHSSFT